MAIEVAQHAQRNGKGDGKVEPEAVGGRRWGAIGSLLGGTADLIKEQISRRIDSRLEDRDPDYLREMLPLLWIVSTFYFRGEVRNLGNIPRDRPVLLVGNHSGGNVIVDTFIFSLAFSTYFGVERPFHQLAHNLAIAWPFTGYMLRRSGTMSASHENAERALKAGAPVLVYPGGDWETHRPSWEGNKVDFAGRKGFIRLALDADVPIVPVVSIGGQETALFLSRGAWLAKARRLDDIFRVKVLPISIAPPWGLNIGDMAGHIPLPAKITVEVLPPINLREDFGPEPDRDEVYSFITSQMQQTLDGLAAERRFPVIG